MAAMIAIPNAMTTGTYRPRMVPLPIESWNPVGTEERLVPPVSRSAAPKAMPSVPSVAMKGGRRRRVTRRPFSRPHAVPAASATRMPIGTA